MDWQWIIAVVIIFGLVLAIWARVSGMTIPELLGDLRDFISDMKGGVEDQVVYE